jgi:hypothetical protein
VCVWREEREAVGEGGCVCGTAGVFFGQPLHRPALSRRAGGGLGRPTTRAGLHAPSPPTARAQRGRGGALLLHLFVLLAEGAHRALGGEARRKKRERERGLLGLEGVRARGQTLSLARPLLPHPTLLLFSLVPLAPPRDTDDHVRRPVHLPRGRPGPACRRPPRVPRRHRRGRRPPGEVRRLREGVCGEGRGSSAPAAAALSLDDTSDAVGREVQASRLSPRGAEWSTRGAASVRAGRAASASFSLLVAASAPPGGRGRKFRLPRACAAGWPPPSARHWLRQCRGRRCGWSARVEARVAGAGPPAHRRAPSGAAAPAGAHARRRRRRPYPRRTRCLGARSPPHPAQHVGRAPGHAAGGRHWHVLRAAGPSIASHSSATRKRRRPPSPPPPLAHQTKTKKTAPRSRRPPSSPSPTRSPRPPPLPRPARSSTST